MGHLSPLDGIGPAELGLHELDLLLAQGVVLMKGADMTPVLRFSLTDCLPIKLKAAALNAKEGSIAIEELQIAYSSFTVQPA